MESGGDGVIGAESWAGCADGCEERHVGGECVVWRRIVVEEVEMKLKWSSQ